MKRILQIVIIVLCAIQISNAQTESINGKNYNLGEVIVTAKKESIVKATSISDISWTLIENVSNIDVTNSLDMIPGIKITSTSKNESKIYMRGYDQRQISIFLDGVPVYEPYSGFIDLSNLPVVSIEKVTISKGMPSILYGPNSMAGSINFITKRATENISAVLNLEKGFGTNIAGGVSGEIGYFNYSLNGAHYNSNGYDIPAMRSSSVNEDGGMRENSQFEKLGGMVKVGLERFHDFDIIYSFMFIDNEKGIPTDIYSSKPKYWRYTEWKKNVHNIMLRTFVGSEFTLRANMFYENYDNVLDAYDDNSYTTQENRSSFHSVYDDHSLGININAAFITGVPGQTRIAFQYKNDVHKESGNFNEPFAEYKAETMSLGVEHEAKPLENLDMIAGVSYDYLNPVYADGNGLRSSTAILNGHLGFGYSFLEKLNLHANISKKSRFPTLKEFYTETIGRDVANPDLKVEESINTEIGAYYNFADNFFGEMNLFYNSVNNIINIVYLEDGLRQYQNIGKTNFTGIEIAFGYRADQISIGLNYTYLESKNFSDNRESDHLEYRPAHIINFISSYKFEFGLFVEGELAFAGNRYGVDSNSYSITTMEDYILTNIYISQILNENFIVYFRINNLLDEYYEEEFGFPQPGRELIGGAKITL